MGLTCIAWCNMYNELPNKDREEQLKALKILHPTIRKEFGLDTLVRLFELEQKYNIIKEKSQKCTE